MSKIKKTIFNYQSKDNVIVFDKEKNLSVDEFYFKLQKIKSLDYSDDIYIDNIKRLILYRNGIAKKFHENLGNENEMFLIDEINYVNKILKEILII